MTNEIYSAPTANLENEQADTLTASQRLAQTRKEMESVTARNVLLAIWGVRLACNVIGSIGLIFYVWPIFQANKDLDGSVYSAALFAVLLVFILLESITIVAFFLGRRWTMIPLHVFAAIALLNFPAGTILSIVHYVYGYRVIFKR